MKTVKLLFISSIISSTSMYSQTLSDAVKQTTNEQYETAEASFKALLQGQPNNGDIYFYYGENYFKNENLEMANTLYQKGVDVNATNPLCYAGLGKIKWYKGKQAEAKTDFYKAATLAKTYKYDGVAAISEGGKNTPPKAKFVLNSEAVVLAKTAEAYIKSENKNVADAQTLLAQAIKLEPNNPEIIILTGDAYLEQNDGTKAIEYYEKAGALDPKSVKSILRQGQLFYRAKNYNLALDLYKKALSIDSLFAPAYLEMAEIYVLAGQFNKAVPLYKRYLLLNNNCSARANYAGSLNRAKQYKESIEAVNEALKCDSANIYLYRYKGYSQYETGDYPNGLAAMNKFFDKAAKKTDFKIIVEDYEYRAKLLSKNNKDSLAILDYAKALEAHPDKIELIGDIATAYMKMKKWAEAISFFNKKIALGKPNINDYYGLVRAYYYSKDFVKADSAVAQMIQLQPDLALGHLWKAKVNIQEDLKNEKWLAKASYEAYLAKVKPEDADKNKRDLIDAYNYLAAYYAEKKDCASVKLYMQKVLELDPANAQAKKVLAGLKC